MRSVAEHRSIVADLLRPRSLVESPLAEALGLASARDITAPLSLPGFDNSAMDGYAVVAADVATASESNPVRLPVDADIPAGRVDGPPLKPGTAHRIMTGAPVPPGADAIVPVELTDGGTETVTFFGATESGRHIRLAGGDVRAGDLVLTAGRRLGAPQLGLLSALGLPTVTVSPPLRVLVLSTGSELVRPGEPLQHGQIHESNGIMLASAVREAGAIATQRAFVADDADAFLSALQTADVDLVLTSGGVSAGAYEVVKDTLSTRGVEFAKVAMQPGMPQGAGRFEGVPVVTLPGNPVSALVSFEVFVRPALLRAMGFTDTERSRTVAELTQPIRSPQGKRQFQRGVHDRSAGTVHPIGPPASHHLRWLAASNCLLEIPEDITEMSAGDSIAVWDLGD